ncbi:MAG: FTR1 family iron permease [Chloroflexi bacterium]|nr:FTR1 family iron permease [Chloroflexota bacterium]
MAAAFLIGLREGLEAALIVGIICAYLVKVDRRDVLWRVVVGVVLAVVLSVAVGVVIVTFVEGGRLPFRTQATLEGIAAIVAVAMVTWMLFWMRRQGRSIKGELEAGVAAALASGSARALIGLAFLAVIREGIETTLFFMAILGSQTGDVRGALIAGLAGLVVAAGIGWAIFAMGKRVNLARFFTVTGVVLIFVAAGLVVYAVTEFTEAGFLPVQQPLFDLSGVLPTTSPLGSVLNGLFGYRAAPTPNQVIAWLLYVIPVLTLYLSDRRPWGQRPAPAGRGAG